MTRRKFLLGTLIASGLVLLAGVGAYQWFQWRHFEPWQYLAFVGHETDEAFSDAMQATTLAFLGRDDEVRAMPLYRSVNPDSEIKLPASKVLAEELEIHVTPWRTGLESIAADHRLVMLMEHHFYSKHREFIGASLPVLRDAGFTHYAAEAISRLESGLASRGYPSKFTGVYTSDPQFGNTLRRALGLGFEVFGYDFRTTTLEEREEYAATRLAQVLRGQGEAKLVVHAGPSHVLKHPTELQERWLASLLWEKTGVEPFTIWQWSRGHGAEDYEKIVQALEAKGIALDEPVLLMPPPAFDCGLVDTPYRLAPVDAIVIHPPDQSVAPDRRTVLFPNAMQRLIGRWDGGEWPVIVSAYQRDEPVSAIALDQVMLRQGETDFVLWIPNESEYTIRVFNRDGLMGARSHRAVSVSSRP